MRYLTITAILHSLSHLSEMLIAQVHCHHHTVPVGLYGVNCACRHVSCLRHGDLVSIDPITRTSGNISITAP
ncbi:MAG: hypothetical protein IJK85_03060 [Bacteroidales bacterium]|nr:hypothetical protein [Bacteroidales bacterium]